MPIRADAAKALAKKLIPNELRSDENCVNMGATLIMIDVEADEIAAAEEAIPKVGLVSLADYAKAKGR